MAKYKSILCPRKDDHKFEKFLLFVGKEELCVFCKDHLWISIAFKKGNEKINFENAAIVMEPMGEDFHFDHEPMPVLALGKFNLRRKTRAKRYANKSE